MMAFERARARKVCERLIGEGMALITEEDEEWDDLVDDEAFWYDFEMDWVAEGVNLYAPF